MDDTDETTNCPHCGADLCETADDGRVGFRTILVEIPEVYDGGLYWMCPDCLARWHRWPVGHYLRRKAHRYVCDMDIG